jgi:hypothetical protein
MEEDSLRVSRFVGVEFVKQMIPRMLRINQSQHLISQDLNLLFA